MEGFPVAIVFVVGVLLALGIWVAAMSFDKDRISGYVQERGGRIVSINWAPFGKGWFGEKKDRIYEVVYYDRQGNQHWATCKTSLFAGVYWTEDRITYGKAKWYDDLPPANDPGEPAIRFLPSHEETERNERDEPSPESLDEEIARLKTRLLELEKRKKERGA